MAASVGSETSSLAENRSKTFLSDMYHNHVTKQSNDRQKIDRSRRQLVENCSRTTEIAVEYLNEGVAKAYMNESRLNAITSVGLNMKGFSFAEVK